jgi:hypothetical protein
LECFGTGHADGVVLFGQAISPGLDMAPRGVFRSDGIAQGNRFHQVLVLFAQHAHVGEPAIPKSGEGQSGS